MLLVTVIVPLTWAMPPPSMPAAPLPESVLLVTVAVPSL
jgi:hypothetical protein